MSLEVKVVDGRGTPAQVKVTSIGQIVISPYAYDESKFNELAAANTAYNFYTPKAGEQFVITGVFAVADKQVSSSVSADLVVYEATADDTTSVSKVLIQTAIVQDQIQAIMPLNILVSEGKYVNAKTTDDDVHMTIFGYYIPTG